MIRPTTWSAASALAFAIVALAKCGNLMGEEVTPSATECESAYACCDDCCREPLLGFIQPTDPCWSDFISPMTNPVFFEDPRTLTEARLIFAQHNIPSLFGGDVPASDIQVLALQLRVALTENLSLIATKDGFIFTGADAPLDDGWADVALGLKYNVWKDVDLQRIVSLGATFELPVGTARALQGNGDGEFNLFATGAAQLGDWNHFVTATGIRLPSDVAEENQVLYWSAHLDRQIFGRCWYSFLEFNWYHWLRDGDNAAFAGLEGLDFFNLGATDVAGSDIVTGAFGLKWKPTTLGELGMAWEVPLTENRGLIDNRLTVDWIVRY